MYRVRIKRAAEKSLARIAEPWQGRIQRHFANWRIIRGRQGVKLTGRDAWRLRVADYRIIDEIHDKILLMLVVNTGHRREIDRCSGNRWR